VAWQALSLLRAVEWFPATTYEFADPEWRSAGMVVGKIREVRCRGFCLRAMPFVRVLATHSSSGTEYDSYTAKDDFFQLLLASSREFIGVSALVSLDIKEKGYRHTVHIGRAQLTAFRDSLSALDLPAARLSDGHLIGLLFHLALSSTHEWARPGTIRRPPGDHDCRGQTCELCDYEPCPVAYILQSADKNLLVEFPPGEDKFVSVIVPANDPKGGGAMWDCFDEAMNIVFPEGRWGQSDEEEEEYDDMEPEEDDEEGGWEEDEEEHDDEEDEHEDGDEGDEGAEEGP
jgi:hypothetical protein